MAVRISAAIDEERLAEAGLSTGIEDIMAELDGLRAGRLSLQTRDRWLPLRDLKVQPALAAPRIRRSGEQ
jgi:hypothetical protein